LDCRTGAPASPLSSCDTRKSGVAGRTVWGSGWPAGRAGFPARARARRHHETSEGGCARNPQAPGAVGGGSRSGQRWRRALVGGGAARLTVLSARRSAHLRKPVCARQRQVATRCRTACKQHRSVAATSHLCRCVTTGAGAARRVRRNSSTAAWLVRRRQCGCYAAASASWSIAALRLQVQQHEAISAITAAGCRCCAGTAACQRRCREAPRFAKLHRAKQRCNVRMVATQHSSMEQDRMPEALQHNKQRCDMPAEQ